MGKQKKKHPLQREIIQEHHGAQTGVRVNPTPGSPCIQETQNINYVLSLQFTTCDFGFSLLMKERKKEREREGRRIEGQNIWDDKHSSTSSESG